MSWQEWLGSLLMLLGIGGIVILLAEALCCLLGIVILLAEALCCLLGPDRKRPEPEEFQGADADALVAEISREIEAEAARIARRCEVRR
jgi:hypothetical protein